MFRDVAEWRDKVTDAEHAKVTRCAAMYMWMLERPHAKDSEFVAEACGRFGVTRPTAYSDLATLQALIPQLAKTARDFHRWRSAEMILDTYAMAREKKDTRIMEKAAADYMKLFRADDDREEIDLSDITPQPFVPTMDPRVLGIEPLPNLRERKRKLLEQLTREVADVRDIDYEEIDTG